MFTLVSFLLHPIASFKGWRRSRAMFYPDGSSRPGNGQFDDPLRREGR